MKLGNKLNTELEDRQGDPLQRLVPGLQVWRILERGNREFVEALPRPPRDSGRLVLDRELAGWPGVHYWTTAAKNRLILIRALAPEPRGSWSWRLGLLVLTIVCTLGAGAALSGDWYLWRGSGLTGAVEGAGVFMAGIFQGDWRFILTGWPFAVPLLVILIMHEAGHVFAARRYGVAATPPVFIPVPPTLSPIGTLGAMIRLRSMVPDRRQLIAIGAAGPLLGLVPTLVALIWGYSISERVEIPGVDGGAAIWFAGQAIKLGDSLLTNALATWLVPGSGTVRLSLTAFAGWVGAFITALNLLPISQLDGGHIAYGMVGRRQRYLAWGAVAVLLALGGDAVIWYVWVGATWLMGRNYWRHPGVPLEGAEVAIGHRLIGMISLFWLVATFVPVPFH